MLLAQRGEPSLKLKNIRSQVVLGVPVITYKYNIKYAVDLKRSSASYKRWDGDARLAFSIRIVSVADLVNWIDLVAY